MDQSNNVKDVCMQYKKNASPDREQSPENMISWYYVAWTTICVLWL